MALESDGITIYSKSAAEQDMGFDFSTYQGTGMIKLAFVVENVDDEYRKLKSLDNNIEFITVPTTSLWGDAVNTFSAWCDKISIEIGG